MCQKFFLTQPEFVPVPKVQQKGINDMNITEKQKDLLYKKGVSLYKGYGVWQLTLRLASEAIDKIAKNGWKRPETEEFNDPNYESNVDLISEEEHKWFDVLSFLETNSRNLYREGNTINLITKDDDFQNLLKEEGFIQTAQYQDTLKTEYTVYRDTVQVWFHPTFKVSVKFAVGYGSQDWNNKGHFNS